MGERSVFRDIVLMLLAVVAIIELFVIMRQNDHYEQRIIALAKAQSDQQQLVQEQSGVLREILGELKKPGRAVTVLPGTTVPETPLATGTRVVSGEASDDMVREEWDKLYTDPNAQSGGTYYRALPSDPGTLNLITESNYYVQVIYEYITQSLLTQDYKNPDVWVPELATSWSQEQVSWGIPAKGDGAQLVERIKAGLPADAKKWITPTLEKDGRVRLKIQKLGEEYLAEVARIVPMDNFVPVQWVQTKNAPTAGEKDWPDSAKIIERFRELIAKKPELKLAGEQAWMGEAGFIFRLPGSKQAAEALVGEFLNAKEQQGPAGAVWMVDRTETLAFEDKLYFSFKLRSGVKWNDGVPLSVNDFLFTFKAIKDPGINCQHLRNYFADCESVEALDAESLRFTWRKLFQGAFAWSAGFPIMPEHVFKYTDPNDFNNSKHNMETFGTGPYTVKEWVRGQRMVLERNEHYWGQKPNFDRVYYRIISESAVRLQMLKNKELDISALSPNQWANDVGKPPFGTEHGLTALKQYALYYNYLGWNARRPELADKRVRRALTLSIDRDTILKELLFNLGMVVSGTFFSLGPYNDTSIKPLPYDPDAAKKLFAEVGLTRDSSGFLQKEGKRFSVKISFPASSEVAKKILVAVQSDLKKSGVACDLDPVESAVFLERVRRQQFDAIFLGWSLSWDPDPYQLWHSSQAVPDGSNHCSFINKECDELIDKLRRTFDKDERVKLCHRIHAILHEEQPYTFMFNSMDLFAHNSDLRNAYLPLKPGEKRDMYFPIVSEHTFSRFWWMPKADQHK